MLLVCSLPFNGFPQSATDAYATMDGTSGTYYVILSDTSNIAQIETQLGSSSGQSDVLNYTFNYDVTTGLPGGYGYSRQGNKLTLTIANVSVASTYFGSVRIKNGSGSWSSTFTFITN